MVTIQKVMTIVRRFMEFGDIDSRYAAQYSLVKLVHLMIVIQLGAAIER